MAAAVATTVGGLYIIVNQDLSHGEHVEHVEPLNEEKFKEDAEKAPALMKEKTESKQTVKEKAQANDATNVDVPKVEKHDANEEDASKDEPEKADNQEEDTHSESREKASEDKKKEHKDAKAQASQEKQDDEAAASPDKSDKVSTEWASTGSYTNARSLTLARSPRASTRCPVSSRACPTTRPTTRRRSPSSPRSPRRARVLLRPLSSRAPSPPTDPALRTRRSAARPSWTRTREDLELHPSNHLCHLSTLATNVPLVAPCIVPNLHYSSVHDCCASKTTHPTFLLTNQIPKAENQSPTP